MRKVIPARYLILLISSAMLLFVACNKEMSATNNSNNTGTNTSSSSSTTIAVASDSSGSDSVYILQQCEHGFFRDSVDSSALPSVVLNYLTANYAGYSFHNGYIIKDSTGTIGGYVVIIIFNGKPVGLLFDASGNFRKVLEQREHGDLDGEGWHHGGRFEDRDGKHRDTIALSALPTAVSSYMTVNYPSDTLLRAYQNWDSSILVVSKDNGIFATLFNSTGEFVKRVTLTPPQIPFIPLTELVQILPHDSLPGAALTFLTNTYPNYVFDNAVSLSVNNQVLGYMVVIDANNTKYAVWFDASGNLIVTLTIW